VAFPAFAKNDAPAKTLGGRFVGLPMKGRFSALTHSLRSCASTLAFLFASILPDSGYSLRLDRCTGGITDRCSDLRL
jgi:hypothetical protein